MHITEQNPEETLIINFPSTNEQIAPFSLSATLMALPFSQTVSSKNGTVIMAFLYKKKNDFSTTAYHESSF